MPGFHQHIDVYKCIKMVLVIILVAIHTHPIPKGCQHFFAVVATASQEIKSENGLIQEFLKESSWLFVLRTCQTFWDQKGTGNPSRVQRIFTIWLDNTTYYRKFQPTCRYTY